MSGVRGVSGLSESAKVAVQARAGAASRSAGSPTCFLERICNWRTQDLDVTVDSCSVPTNCLTIAGQACHRVLDLFDCEGQATCGSRSSRTLSAAKLDAPSISWSVFRWLRDANGTLRARRLRRASGFDHPDPPRKKAPRKKAPTRAMPLSTRPPIATGPPAPSSARKGTFQLRVPGGHSYFALTETPSAEKVPRRRSRGVLTWGRLKPSEATVLG